MVRVVDLSLFSAERLAHPVGLADALRHLELLLVVSNTDDAVAQIVRELSSVPGLFGFLISAWPNSKKLVDRIFSAFPKEPALIPQSFVKDLLFKISHTLFSIPPDLLSTDLSKNIGQFRQYVDNVLPVLAMLCCADFASETSVTEEHAELIDDIPFFKQKVKKQRRRVKQTAAAVDPALFFKLGVPVPTTNEAARRMANDIAERLKLVLDSYLSALSSPELAMPLKNAYVQLLSDHSSSERPRTVVKPSTSVVVETQPSAYPTVQPMKAALYFDNADGFGEWRILIGTNVTKKLREFRENDRQKFKIVVKKIKELSHGRFSDDNQKRLDGARSGVPIFEAKIQQDLRIVYQIDCVSDHEGEIERQGSPYIHPPVHPGDNVFLPAVFPPEVHDVVVKPPPLVLGDKEMDQLHSLLVLEKYITFSQALINGIIARKNVQHVFELTNARSSIVLHRVMFWVEVARGEPILMTEIDGMLIIRRKTITMLFKMLGIQRAWQLQSEGSGMPRPRQIFVTKSPVLANKVEEYFVKLLESLSLAGYTLEELARLQPSNMDLEMVDPDDVPDTQNGIPQRYSELEDHHFPLFLTFDRLARMIAADILEADHPEAKHYDTFANTYWPHFPQPLTKGLDPWLVFGEIVGIIKGSEKSLGFDDGILDKKTYCGLPSRSNPTFSGQRELVYAVFEAYSKLKRQRQHHDVADRTHAVLKTLLGATSLKGRQVDYLYVDEAQDNLLIDALLLRLICCNPEGLFWAGDTAQTISASSSFRFDDLKAFLHRIEVGGLNSVTSTKLNEIQVDQTSHMVRERRIAPPMSFQLAINYRSHGGIVNCAHSVIELISRFWPNSIDSLQPEHGIVDGLKPVFFTGWDKDAIGYEQFLFGAPGSHIEFGAQQCELIFLASFTILYAKVTGILVRNEKAREKLRQQVGDIGLIMTLYESKGLEFNDVLLYNFFEDSNVDLSRWRLVLAAINSGFDGHSPCRPQAPCFERNESRYAGVCGELKLLYVGITRARKNMWIADKSDKAEPMRIFWTSLSSTPEEWAESGLWLFHHRRYTQAMHCFGRAEMPREVRIAEAYHFRELARATVGVALASEQRQAFAKAADAFDKCGSETPGRLKLRYYHTAAECYVRAADDRKAADAYLNAEAYELAAKRYRKAGIFDKTVDVLKSYSKKMSPDCADELLKVCRLYYCSKDDEKPPSSLFSSFEEELDFLETYGLDVALVVLYESHGKYVEAAELHLSEDEPLDAIGVLLKDKTNQHAMRRAADILLDCLWKHCSFGVSPKEFHAGIPKTLISFSHQLPLNLLSPRARDEIKMFQTAAAEEPDRVALETLAESFIEQKDNAAALWCLNHVFSCLLSGGGVGEVGGLRPNSSENSTRRGLRKLFAITQLSDDQYDVQAGSFILATPSTVSTSNDEQTNGSQYTHGQVTNALKDRVRSYLRHQVDTETRLCYSAKIFSQCLLYSVIGSCKYGKCKQQHVSLSSLDSTQYNARVGIHLQQIRILQLVYSAFPEMREQNSVKGEIADWIAHLYEAFFPPFRAQGSLADLKWSSIQGASDGIRVVRHWVRDAIYALEPRYSADFLTDILRLIKLSSVFGESDALQNANCVRRYRPKAFFRYPGRYIVEDMIESNQSATEASIFVGILGLRHAIRTNIQVNLSVLCDCIEEVFSAYVITLRLKTNPGAGSLHDVVLPRSWLVRNNKLDARKDVTNINHFLNDIQYLLEKLRSDSTEEHLWLLHTNVTPVHRSIFIARIMLCLASYNCPPLSVDLKGRISSIMNRLRSNDPARPTPYIYRHYAQTARDDYLHVIVAYDENHAIPNLVHLRCKGHATSLETSRLATRSPSPLIVARSQLRVEAPVFVPRAGISLQTKPAEDHVDLCLEIDSAQLDKPVGDEEESAAGLIQRVYRLHREKQRRLLERPTLEAERSAIYATCLKHAQDTGVAPGFYRLLYLGPLPHLLLALRKGITMATFVRNTTKIPGLLLKEGHERLEELGRNRSEISSTLKQGHELLKKLSPDSQFHKNRDIGALKDAVLQVKEFLHRIPGGARGSPEELNIAYKAIVAEKHVPKEKPSLNVEDLDP
ncbi:hypothetical protein F5J12DRAFT_895738 [Pisolithus orientalis]|uniref:uncharacterized protein n=1 Tax=Pisolithus orientalis TaxID=936130 RepID=UPI002224F602|nr:uncharacterized protein F5J12DRAFT_895738 [Pisolithus orientalis]KAI5997877.1 hypothetical protein F5J12DRAFT_895738 [Pisolithus orientalis]